jgi:hypothetical protein
MLHRFALVVFLVAGCQAPRTHSSDDGTHAPDAGPVIDSGGGGGDAGPGSDCGGACPDGGMDGGTSTIAFDAPQTYAGGGNAYFMTVADLDGDGALDLVESCAWNGRGEVHLLRGTGTGAFTDVATIAVPTFAFSPDHTVVSDFDGDGIADIAGLDVDGHGSLPGFYLQGQGNFQYAQSWWGESTGRDFGISNSLVGGDFDEDGTLDLVGAYYGDTTLLDAFVILKMPGFVVLQTQTEDHTYAGSEMVAAGDFDGDGHQDVVTANGVTQDVSVYRGNGSGTVNFAGATTLPGIANYRVIAADLDRDGRSDVIVLHTDGTASVSYGTSAGLAPAQLVQPIAPYAAWIAAGDFDGDGRLDLAVLNNPPSAGATVDVFRNTTAGFTHAVTLDVPGISVPWSIATGDFNGDGRADLAVPSAGAELVRIYLAAP